MRKALAVALLAILLPTTTAAQQRKGPFVVDERNLGQLLAEGFSVVNAAVHELNSKYDIWLRRGDLFLLCQARRQDARFACYRLEER